MKIKYILPFFTLFFLAQCKEETTPVVEIETPIPVIEKDTIDKTPLIAEIEEIKYDLFAVKDTIAWLKKLKGDSLRTVLILNRVDERHLFQQDSLVLPQIFRDSLDDYCPFPLYVDSLKALNKMIYVSRFAQIFAVYENGKRIKWGPTSTGKETTQTPAGLFTTNWKSKRNISSVNSSWILNWCFNISNADGVSLHEYSLPGYPGSHSCVRLYAEDAKWFYYWADQWILKENESVQVFGTPVIIFGDYPYHDVKPWRQLANNNQVLVIAPEQLMMETAKDYELILARQETRVYTMQKRAEADSLKAI